MFSNFIFFPLVDAQSIKLNPIDWLSNIGVHAHFNSTRVLINVKKSELKKLVNMNSTYINFIIICECNEFVEYETYLPFIINVKVDSYCGTDQMAVNSYFGTMEE